MSAFNSRVLVAEDHPVNRQVMGLLLGSLGVEGDMVEDGRQAIEAAREESYSLILMDIMMPSVDGFEASYEIRRREFGHGVHTPIIAVTAMDHDDILEKCISCGMDDYVGKPISKELLADKIKMWSDIKVVGEKAPAPNPGKHSHEHEPEVISSHLLKMLYGVEHLEDVVELFLTVTDALLHELEVAIHHQDEESVRRMAHEIKGSSIAITAKEMAQLCLELERQGQEQNWSQAAQTYTALALAFSRVRHFSERKPSQPERHRRAS